MCYQSKVVRDQEVLVIVLLPNMNLKPSSAILVF